MAAKNSKKAAPQSAPPAAESKSSRPQVQVASFDTFQGEEVSVPDIDGWYSPEQGEKGWVGRIINQFRMKDAFNDGKMRTVVVVRLLSDCASAVDADGEPATLEAGQTMAVSIKAKLADLLDYVEKHGTVGVRAVEKKALTKGRSMWVFSIKGQPGARVMRDQLPNQSAPQGDYGEPNF